MRNNLISEIKNFMKIEHIGFSISEYNSSEFWLDDLNNSLTVRFKINFPEHQILYDVYSTEYAVHLKEETLKDVERLDYLAEENKKWKIVEGIEDIWLILDEIKLWANRYFFTVKEKQLI